MTDPLAAYWAEALTGQSVARDCWQSLCAAHYLERGWRPIPIDAGAKDPCVKWKPYQNRLPTSSELRRWQARFRHGVALVTGGSLVVVDVDVERPDFAETCQRLRGASGAEVRTPSGGAAYRTIARLSGVEHVSKGNALSRKGQAIRAALAELAKRGYVSARIEPPKTTRIRIRWG